MNFTPKNSPFDKPCSVQGFSTTVKAEWLDGEPRKMRVLEDVTYTDKNGVVWTAKADSIVDGASIPRFCWYFIGSPFVGLYRRPSVIHDVYCENKEMPWKLVHACFKEMMLFEGVHPHKAKLMFDAVFTFGPRWGGAL